MMKIFKTIFNAIDYCRLFLMWLIPGNYHEDAVYYLSRKSNEKLRMR